MEKTPRQLWVEALRSGEYTQATGALQSADGYCCLGVACEVAEKHGVDVRRDGNGTIIGGHLGDQINVRKWLGLAWGIGACGNGPSLVTLNDDGSTFAEIGDHIESEPKGMFKDG